MPKAAARTKQTNLPEFSGVEAFVDAEVAAVERGGFSSADDALQLGHVLLQRRVDELLSVQHGHAFVEAHRKRQQGVSGTLVFVQRHPRFRRTIRSRSP